MEDRSDRKTPPNLSELRDFDTAMRKIVAVDKAELARREKLEKERRKESRKR